jgi:Tetraspanin family
MLICFLAFYLCQLHCCGVDNYTDWLTLPWHQEYSNESYPVSCCQERICINDENATTVYLSVSFRSSSHIMLPLADVCYLFTALISHWLLNGFQRYLPVDYTTPLWKFLLTCSAA